MIVIIIIVILIFAIIFLSGNSPFNEMPRDEFFRGLEKVLNAKLAPIEGKEDSFRIEFKFEEEDFIYEDVIQKGFRGDVNEAYLKVKMPSKFSLTFSERKKEAMIKSEVLMASEMVDDPDRDAKRITLPKGFERLKAYTNDVALANKLFMDPKVAGIFSQFVNVDNRGCPSVSLKIIDGIVILEFHSSTSLNPNRRALRNNISSLENYCDKLLVVVKKIRGSFSEM